MKHVWKLRSIWEAFDLERPQITLDVEIKLLMQYKIQHTSNFRLDMDLAILLLPTLKSLQTADIPEMPMADYSSAFIASQQGLAVDTLNIFEKFWVQELFQAMRGKGGRAREWCSQRTGVIFGCFFPSFFIFACSKVDSAGWPDLFSHRGCDARGNE